MRIWLEQECLSKRDTPGPFLPSEKNGDLAGVHAAKSTGHLPFFNQERISRQKYLNQVRQI